MNDDYNETLIKSKLCQLNCHLQHSNEQSDDHAVPFYWWLTIDRPTSPIEQANDSLSSTQVAKVCREWE